MLAKLCIYQLSAPSSDQNKLIDFHSYGSTVSARIG